MVTDATVADTTSVVAAALALALKVHTTLLILLIHLFDIQKPLADLLSVSYL